MITVIEKCIKDDLLSEILELANKSSIKWKDEPDGKYHEMYGKKALHYSDLENETFNELMNKFKTELVNNKAWDTFSVDVPILLGPLIRFSKYNVDMKYDWHTDHEFIGFPEFMREPVLSNYAYSLIVNDDYEGGEFEIKLPTSYKNGKMEVKTFQAKSGDVIIWPTNYSHRVKTITKGSRIVINGWLTHTIKNHNDLSEIIFVHKMMREIAEESGDEISSTKMELVKKLVALKATLIAKHQITK